MNPYETLGVPEDADAKTIKGAYRRAAQKSHPDRKGGDEEEFHQIQIAYEVLSDPDRRARYDETGETGDQRSALQEAEARVVEVFNHIIESGKAGDLVEEARSMVTNARENGQNDERKTQKSIEKYEKLLGRVKAKEGDNLFQMVLDKKLDEAKSRLAMIRRTFQIIDEMEAILEAYFDDRPEREPAPYFTHEMLRSSGLFGGMDPKRFGF